MQLGGKRVIQRNGEDIHEPILIFNVCGHSFRITKVVEHPCQRPSCRSARSRCVLVSQILGCYFL